MSPAWKSLLKKTLAARDMTYVDLERKLGASKGAVTKLFAQNTSVWVQPICDLLSIPHPSRMDEDADEQGLLNDFRQLSPQQKQQMRQYATRMKQIALAMAELEEAELRVKPKE